ncbi:MAG: hypothetical protein U1E43_07690 [Rhodospirillales bacterium]
MRPKPKQASGLADQACRYWWAATRMRRAGAAPTLIEQMVSVRILNTLIDTGHPALRRRARALLAPLVVPGLRGASR